MRDIFFLYSLDNCFICCCAQTSNCLKVSASAEGVVLGFCCWFRKIRKYTTMFSLHDINAYGVTLKVREWTIRA